MMEYGIQISLEMGHHPPVSETPFKWRFAGVSSGLRTVIVKIPGHTNLLGNFVFFQGILTSIAKKPYNFVIFQGGPDPCPPLDPHMAFLVVNINTVNNNGFLFNFATLDLASDSMTTRHKT